MSTLFGRKPLVALDIGSSSIKLCQLEKTDKGVKLVRFDIAMLPLETGVGGFLMNRTAVVEKIRELLKATKCVDAECALSISGHSVIVKKISVPEMTADELKQSLQWEAEQYIPFNIKDVHVDAQILNPKAGQGMMDVLLVAAKKDVINDYMNVARDEIIALVNVGASTMNINVISNGITTFTRDICMGGSLVTEEIMKQLNVSWEEAELYKIDIGSVEVESSAIFREVQKIHERVSERLVTEVQRTLDFFAATTINYDIARMYLSGGASQVSALIRAMERRLEIPVELVNPFKNISIDCRKFDLDLIQKMGPIATVAVGLARRSVGDEQEGKGVRINLLRKEYGAPFITGGRPRLPLSISFRIPLTKTRFTTSLTED